MSSINLYLVPQPASLLYGLIKINVIQWSFIQIRLK